MNMWRGIPYLASWPQKKQRPLPTHTTEQNEWFRQANIAFKYMDATVQMAFRDATAGTPLYPRDAALMTMAGTLTAFRLDNGRILYSMATRKGVNDSLKVLGSDDAGVLVFVNGWWIPISPTTEDQVLVSGPSGVAPEWRTGPPGGGRFLTGINPSSVNTANVATQGWYTTNFVDVFLKAVIPYFQSSVGGKYKIQVWATVENVLQALLYESPEIETEYSAFIRHSYELPATIKLDANSTYCFLMVRTDGTGVSPTKLWTAQAQSKPNYPWLADITPVSTTILPLSPLDVMTKGTASLLYSLDLLYSL